MSQETRKIRFGLWYDFRNPTQWRQPADRLVRQVRGGGEQYPADQRGQPAVERDPAQVHVAARVLPRGEHEIAVHDALGLDPY